MERKNLVLRHRSQVRRKEWERDFLLTQVKKRRKKKRKTSQYQGKSFKKTKGTNHPNINPSRKKKKSETSRAKTQKGSEEECRRKCNQNQIDDKCLKVEVT